MDAARVQIAALIGALPEEIVFTSGATEANNLAIRGVAACAGARRHLVTCATEHPCVLETCRALRRDGCEVTELPVAPDGLIDLDQLRAALRPATALVSIMTVNHEIGVLSRSRRLPGSAASAASSCIPTPPRRPDRSRSTWRRSALIS